MHFLTLLLSFYSLSGFCLSSNVLDRWLSPLWLSSTIIEEPLIFIKKGASLPCSETLYTIKRVKSLKSGDLKSEYAEGKDFKIGDSNKICLLPSSRIPWKLEEEFYPALSKNSISGMKKDRKREILYSENGVIQTFQCPLTYERRVEDLFKMEKPEPKLLPKAQHLVKEKREMRISILGDSISTGLNSSESLSRPPLQPSYQNLLGSFFRQNLKVSVVMKNFSVSGTDTQWGITMAKQVGSEKPSLVILGFGMNDSGRMLPKAFKENTEQIMSLIRLESPDTEFILLSSMLANPEWIYEGNDRLLEFRNVLKTLEGPGVLVIDLTSVWSTLLQRKKYQSLTGNGLNHPNDFGQRLYAQAILYRAGWMGSVEK